MLWERLKQTTDYDLIYGELPTVIKFIQPILDFGNAEEKRITEKLTKKVDLNEERWNSHNKNLGRN